MPYGGAFTPSSDFSTPTPTLAQFVPTSSAQTAIVYSGTGGNPTQNPNWFNPAGTGASWIGASSTLGLGGSELNGSTATNNAAGFFLFTETYSLGSATSALFSAQFASDNRVDGVYANGVAIGFTQTGGPEFTYKTDSGAISGTVIDGSNMVTLQFIVENTYYLANGSVANPTENPTGLVAAGTLTTVGASVPLPPAVYGGLGLLGTIGAAKLRRRMI
jgi:hypothetical protein